MKVLFLGNSHTYFNDLPAIFRNMCSEKGRDVEVGMLAHPGVTYGWHLGQYTDLRFSLIHGNYDYIIMQQAAHDPQPKEETKEHAKRIVEMAEKQGVKAIQTLPWARLDMPEELDSMIDIFESVATDNSIPLNPVGLVFRYIVNNYPDIRIHHFDGSHASSYGSYANALCTYALFFGCDFEGISGKSYNMYPVENGPDVTDINELTVTLEKIEKIKTAVKNVFEELGNPRILK